MSLIRSATVWLAILPVALIGCGGSEQESDTDTGKVTLGLNWFPEAEHGGYYAAEVTGAFSDAGLTVDIRPGGPNVPVMQQVARKDLLFGITNADQLILARAQGMPLVAVMAPIQDSPRAIMVHEDSGIRSFDELSNITIAMSSGAAWAQFLKANVDFEGVTFLPPGSVAQFLANPEFAQQAYVFSEPFVASSNGGKPHCLMVSELGFNPYTSVLFCHEDTLRDRPELVRQMVDASVQGWDRYLKSPDATNRHIQTLNPEMSAEILAFGADAIRPLCQPDGKSTEIGLMKLSRWEDLIEQMEAVEAIDEGKVQATDVFSGEFLPEPEASENAG